MLEPVLGPVVIANKFEGMKPIKRFSDPCIVGTPVTFVTFDDFLSLFN